MAWKPPIGHAHPEPGSETARSRGAGSARHQPLHSEPAGGDFVEASCHSRAAGDRQNVLHVRLAQAPSKIFARKGSASGSAVTAAFRSRASCARDIVCERSVVIIDTSKSVVSFAALNPVPPPTSR